MLENTLAVETKQLFIFCSYSQTLVDCSLNFVKALSV